MIVRTLADELADQIGRHVRIEGWIHRRRRLAHVTFLILRDRSGLAQVVIDAGEVRSTLDQLGEETVVRVEGEAVANAQAPGGVEIVAPKITALSEPAATPPVELWKPTLTASLPTLLDHAAVSWRHPSRRAVLHVAAASVAGFRGALSARGFTEVQTPKIVDSSTESGANVFELDYFGRPAYLAQSPQFYKQVMVGVFERVYEVGPVFRAEPHDTAPSTHSRGPVTVAGPTHSTCCFEVSSSSPAGSDRTGTPTSSRRCEADESRRRRTKTIWPLSPTGCLRMGDSRSGSNGG